MTQSEGGPEFQGPPEVTCPFVLHTMTRPSLDQRCTFHPGHVGGHSFEIGEVIDAEIEQEHFNPDVDLWKGSWLLWAGLGIIGLGLLLRFLWRRR